MKEIIGIQEHIALPKTKIKSIRAKTDTGAYNSAIDCCYAKEIVNEEGEARLEYILLNPNRKNYTGRKRRTKNFKKKIVRSSNGIETFRYQIKLTIELKGLKMKTTFNLSDRSKMRYPVLLGRKTIAGKFLVDVSINRQTKKSKTK